MGPCQEGRLPSFEPPEFTIADRFGAEQLLLSPQHGGHFQYVVSIGDPGERPPKGLEDHPARVLRLEFHDMLQPPPADWVGIFAPPDPVHVARLVDFCAGIDGPALIHCHAGISRSAAAAFVLVSQRLGPGRELEALEIVLASRPQAWPNRRIVALADERMGRGGALVAALVRYEHGPLD